MVDIQYKMGVNRLLMGQPQTHGTECVALCLTSVYLRTLRLKIPEQYLHFKYSCIFLFHMCPYCAQSWDIPFLFQKTPTAYDKNNFKNCTVEAGCIFIFTEKCYYESYISYAFICRSESNPTLFLHVEILYIYKHTHYIYIFITIKWWFCHPYTLQKAMWGGMPVS